MSLSHLEIKEIVQALQESEWDQAVVTIGDVRIAVGRNNADLLPAPASVETSPVNTPAPTPAVAAPIATPASTTAAPAPVPTTVATPPAPTPAPSTIEGHLVTAPSVGVFWKSPQPGQPPFVEVGSEVEVGDTLCIVEVMKLMSNVTADVAGTIAAIHQDNATQIEHGTPLFTILPRGA